MQFRLCTILFCAVLILTGGFYWRVDAAENDTISLLNATSADFQEQLRSESPEFLDAQKRAIKTNYPLFIFVPGIIGSKLERATPSGRTTLWGAYDTSTPDLSIEDGDDVAVTPSVLYDFKVGRYPIDAYASGISDIITAQLGIELLKQFPYDWRRDNGETAEKLNDWLCSDAVYNDIKDREIRFIAHSMGGLVVKEWFRRYDGQPSCHVAGSNARQKRALNMKEVVFLGTPLFGSPKALVTLVNGFTLVADSFGGMFRFVSDRLDKASVTKALNAAGPLFPSVYQLLPIYHENGADCMDAYTVPAYDWPPYIANQKGTGDKFFVFKVKSWEYYGWPKTLPIGYDRSKYYEFLARTLPQARAFLCRLVQYKFPAGVRVKYFASNSETTSAAFEIRKVPSWHVWESGDWDLDDVGRAPWINGDGTVPMFVARNAMARGITRLEEDTQTERHECRVAHASLLNCTDFSQYVRDVIAVAERAQAVAAKRYLDEHPAEKPKVLKKFGAAQTYFPCKMTASEVDQGVGFSACPINDEIREASGSSVADLLARENAAPPSSQKVSRLEVLAGMRGLEKTERIGAVDNIALASFQAGEPNRGTAISVALAGEAGAASDAYPIKAGDRLVVRAPASKALVALDQSHGNRIEWKYQPQLSSVVATTLEPGRQQSRVQYADGKLYVHQLDTTLVALDSKTGKEVWKVQDGDPKKGELGGTTYVAHDKVIVGTSGEEFGVRAHITAYDAKSGKKVWRSYSTGPDSDILIDPERTLALGKPVGKDSYLKTWTGDQWKIGSGGQVGELVFDPDLKLVYSVSRGSPPSGSPLGHQPATVFARSIDTGEAKWLYQVKDFNPSEDAKLTLAEKQGDAVRRKILEYSDAEGNALTLDASNGELISASK